MKAELAAEIVAVEPAWFLNHSYFECDDGWAPLLLTMFRQIKAIDIGPEDIRVAQIKEKLGGLRAYIDVVREDNEVDPDLVPRLSVPKTQHLYAIINEAEELSFHTCEACGTRDGAKRSGRLWTQTLCNDCLTKANAKLAEALGASTVRKVNWDGT